MKTIFKSLLLTALVMGMATAAMAQGNVGITQNITVNARVLKPITLTGILNVAFGGVFANSNPFLDPKGQATAGVGFTAAVGRVVVDATAGEPIRVEFDTIHLEDGPGPNANKIAYFPIISAYATGDLSATNRDTSILLGTATPTLGAVTVAGTGQGPFGIIATSAAGSPVDRATLLIGGSLGAITSTYGSSPTPQVPISSNQPTGTYTGTLRLNLLYAL